MASCVVQQSDEPDKVRADSLGPLQVIRVFWRLTGAETSVLKYIELKTGQSHRGPAWVARVKLSKSRLTVYFGDKALARLSGGGISGNHCDIMTREEYWVSGVKKNGLDRHWAGGGKVFIESSAVAEYLKTTGASTLDRKAFEVVKDLATPDPAKFSIIENAKL